MLITEVHNFQTTLTQMVDHIKVIAGGDPFITSTLIVAFASIGTTLLYFVTKVLPVVLYQWVIRNYTTSFTVDNGDYLLSRVFVRISTLMEKKSSDMGSRTFSSVSYWDDEDVISVKLSLGIGLHFIMYRGKILLVTLSRLESSGSEKEKKEITIRYFGRSRKLMLRLLEDIRPKDDPDMVKVFRLVDKNWSLDNLLDTGGLDTIALNDDVRDKIRGSIDRFINGKDTCKRLGIAHKLTGIFYGEPGSGKTSIIRAIAKEYDRTVCVLSVSDVSNMANAFASLPKNPLVLIEDFDSIGAVKSRDKKPDDKKTISLFGDSDDYASSGLSEILNTLDGLVSLSEVIVFLTTNHIEKIDKALLRSARVDFKTELPMLSEETVKGHLMNLYPEADKDINFKPLLGCKLYAVKQAVMDDTSKLKHVIENEDY